jgi:hypothetical protein
MQNTPQKPHFTKGKSSKQPKKYFFLLLTFGGKWSKFRPDLNSQKVQIPYPQPVNI